MAVAKSLSRDFFDFDNYVIKDSLAPYIERLDLERLQFDISKCQQTPILSGICAFDVAKELQIANPCVVYVVNVIPGTERYRNQEFCNNQLLLEITPENSYQEVLNNNYKYAQEVIDQFVRVYHKSHEPINKSHITFFNEI
ncbi:hypothetical protein A9Q75_01495 [Colwellia psychrerythraea]|uniref:Uncharacterized protein n=1 Tax=Colwellia psychrerythraea TaxID=28229 RepID=A0A1Y5EVA2_COLPS|nr:hypothetical protein A9Q75_01495 [Colwellia psychrerythraea]